ncbi:MAG: DUF5107 domain-containing protein [Clostridia bacterium]|nr:DUF5107 domain-containing protein [Clostridia bacterium]
MKIRIEILEILGAPLEGLNPLPKFRSRKPSSFAITERFPEKLRETLGAYNKVLPYLMQDRYSRKRLPLKLKSFVLENKYLKAVFLPEYGGRLHSLYDKVNGKELLFTNPVIQPGNLANRNAWLSGGIEWNIGSLGHTYTTCDNVFAAKLTDTDGNDFLRIYEFERLKSIFWQVDFHLPDDSPVLIVHVKMVNPFERDTTTYWWSNVAVPDEGDTRILASGKQVISFVGGKCDFETLPYIDAMPGVDVSYPSNATRSFDYFIQPNSETESTWEAAAYNDGLVFFERSTAPLLYKKLFCWGNHHAGKHWQEFLSDGKGTGYYAEIQAGIAPSQLHDKILPARSSFEWTQCFGGIKLEKEKLYDKNYLNAVSYFDKNLSALISGDGINELNKKLSALADMPVRAENIVHNGSGFGALEAVRMDKDGDGSVPASMFFPLSAIGSEQYPWLNLLDNGILPKEAVSVAPLSYMISYKWLPRLEASLEKEGGRTWFSLMQYGVSLYEYSDHRVLANSVYSDEVNAEQTEKARAAWLASVEAEPSVWAYRNLAVLEKTEGNFDEAEKYYDLAVGLPNVFDDFALVSEYLVFLNERKKYQKLWNLFEFLPENCACVDRVRISAALAAVKLGKTDYLQRFFSEEHYDIREGECSLTDIWFEYCALRMAAERGIDELTTEKLNELIDEAWDLYPPSEDIDFRMSFNKKTRYRIS